MEDPRADISFDLKDRTRENRGEKKKKKALG